MALKVGFIGLGTQGKPLAENLAKAGFDLMVYDLREEPRRELGLLGAKIGGSPREVAQHGEIVEVIVVDDAQVEAVVLGAAGVREGIKPGSVLVVHSTVKPKTVRRLAAELADKRVQVVDAAVSGGATGAQARTMCFMVGGEKEAVERCMPLFSASGTNIFHVGGLGMGLTAKLAHQVIGCTNRLAVFEGMKLAEKAGLAPDLLQAVVHASAAQSKMSDNWNRVKLGPHSAAMLYKDLGLALELGREIGLAMPGTALTQQFIEKGLV
jgi:3-hydroxyisobutyrate dehydrogenase-like beta-hydroxyacid dehydrogenase